MSLPLRVLGALVWAGMVTLILAFVYVALDLRGFEFRPLYRLLGLNGLAVVVSLFGFALLISYFSFEAARGRIDTIRCLTSSRAVRLFALLNLVLTLWLAQWVFVEYPPTAKVVDSFSSEKKSQSVVDQALRKFRDDGSIDALRIDLPGYAMDEASVAIILARISTNRPSVYENVSIGKTIRKYADRYDVHPYILFHWNYIDSFYGEAPAGRMPFFREVNAEMFRDLVQAHLPSWFIESGIRVYLIESPFFDQLLPSSIAWKLRYALQKANYDVSTAPYMNSVLSDLFLVFSEYPDEFPEFLASDDPLAFAFRDLEGHLLTKPYHDPLSIPPRNQAYYSRYRDAIISFTRAAMYRLGEDFDFATKVQALYARYYVDEYKERLGASTWAALSARQQTAMLAMLRDVYMPNIGTPSYNLYSVPEFNTTPINFLSGQASDEIDKLMHGETTWVPAEGEKLWGATGTILRVLSEVWLHATGTPLPGVNPTESLPLSRQVVERQGFEP